MERMGIMAEKSYAIVGNWGFVKAPKGITTYEYCPDTGDLKIIETICSDIAAGQLCIDQTKGIVYVCNECGERRNEVGGGGYILAFHINPENGKLTLINEKESLCPEPSYICLDKSGKYLLVSHCADPWHVTKIKKNEDGSYDNKVLFDDTGIVVFRVNEDGSIGEVCDISITESTNGKGKDSEVHIDPVSGHMQLVRVLSRLHCILSSPDGNLFVTCDKGMDRIYTYGLDRQRGKLKQLDCFCADYKVFPRYAAFHPVMPVFYVNNEFSPILYSFSYDQTTGKMKLLHKSLLLFKEAGLIDGKPAGAQDILVSNNGKTLYCSLVGVNSISVLRLNLQGEPELIQVMPCRGRMPRGLQFSPDGKFLYCGNMLSENITVFAVSKDGTLKDTEKTIGAVSPSAIRFYMPQ